MVEICESFVALLTGAQRFHGNVEDMIGFRFNPWLRICWKYVTPLFCLVRQAARNALWDGSSRIPSQPIPPSTPVALPLSCAIRDTAVSRRTGLFFPVPLNNLVPKLVTGGAGDLRAWERGFTQPPPPPPPPLPGGGPIADSRRYTAIYSHLIRSNAAPHQMRPDSFGPH